jgi:hypothetical protein
LGLLERARLTIARYPLTAVGVGALFALVVGAAIGYASIVSDANKVDDLEADVERLRGELDEANDEVAQGEATVAAAVEDLENRKEAVLADARDKRDQLQAQADDLGTKVSDLEAKLSDLQGEITQTRETVAKSSIPNGIWASGTDFTPGTYRAPGGGGCYWALLGSADTSDIINNGGFNRNQTLTIDSPYFETDGCGTWQLQP